MRKIVSTGARRPEFIPPTEPKLVAKPPGGEDWIHEIKLDGYRSQIVINSPENIRVFTKTGADWTNKYTGLVEAARELEVENAIIDGEAFVTKRPGCRISPRCRKPSTATPIQCISAPWTGSAQEAAPGQQDTDSKTAAPGQMKKTTEDC
ncbi:MAG: hypothetical protein E5Y16_09270 [Mesorhizobium sp.]|nr:MAG: hypothetical protein E5Y16_09270 [Mesorhizobium sp.]